MYKGYRILFSIILIITTVFAQNTLSLSEEGGEWAVQYSSSIPIGGFQFSVDGATINNSQGGTAATSGFMVSASANTVLGFSLSGATIPAGENTLLYLDLNGTPSGLSSLVFSDASGSVIDFEYVENETPDAHYVVDLEETGTTQLTIFSDSITNLEVGDEIGIFDENAITNYNDCSNQIGELLVGAGVWDGSQLNIVSIGSQDLCAFGGVQVSGYVDGNPVTVKVWRASEQMEYATSLEWNVGSGSFGDVIQSVSEISLVGPFACTDDDETVSPFGGCTGAVAALGCDFVFAGQPIGDICPETCDNCPEEPIFGCMDTSACNFDPDATVDSGCEYPMENYDCDGNCVVDIDCSGDCGGDAQLDDCGVCDGDNSSCADCAGTPNGDAYEDNCGVCDSDSTNDCTQDCNGEWGGDAYQNECGCVGGSTGQNDDYCYGCTDPEANNYDHSATIDDGSCDYSEPVDGYTLSISGYDNGQLAVNLANESEIGGFQFTLSSSLNGFTLNNASGGSATDNGFMMSSSSNGTIVGFSLTGGTIPAGSATLLFADISFEGNNGTIWIEDIVLSTPAGGALDSETGDPFSIGDGDIVGCMDEDACNYNPNANQEGECEYAEPNYDCDGNYLGNILSLSNLNQDAGTVDVVLNNSTPVGGFQFSVEGLNIIEAGGGSSAENGFMVSASGSTVVGFSLTGGTIPAGEDVLLTISFNELGEEVCLGNPILSNSSGDQLDVEVGDCLEGAEPIVGCMDENACNYDPSATQAGNCEYPEDNYDCDGNCITEIDCMGECGGSAYWMTFCEDTDGDGLGNPGSEVEECVSGGRDVENGCDLPLHSISLNSNGDVVYNSSVDIGGFQFSVNGGSIVLATGGDAEATGFMISTSGSTVLGFSMTGASFGPCGTMINLNIEGEVNGLSEIVISSSNGSAIQFDYYEGNDGGVNEDLVGNCEDEYPYCAANYYDCNEECGGDAVVDECGDCDGDGPQIECWDGSLVCNESDCTAEPENLFFSEYIEGGSSRKALEIYNPNDYSVSLDGYLINKGTNGATWSEDGYLSLDGHDIDSGDVFTICRSSVPVADECDILIESNSSPMNFNGDDAVGLFYYDSLLDIIGVVGEDPGSGWTINDVANATKNHTLVRDFSVEIGSTNWEETNHQWVIFDVDNFDYLGWHGELITEGCMDFEACNYDSNAGTPCEACCEYPEENYDCDGNCIADVDCAGECGGDAYWMSFCEDTDGDGLGNPGTEVEECISGGGRDITDGCDLPLNTVSLISNGDVLYNSSENIGGFQFSIDGGTLISASGGDAGNAGFMISTSGTTALGFSMTGASFGPCGTVVNLETEGDVSALTNLVFSNSNGEPLNIEYYEIPEDEVDLVANCEDEHPDCAANYYDCNEDCGGSAEIDECGECGGDGPSFECWNGEIVCESSQCEDEPSNNFYNVELEETGQSQLTLFSESINTLEIGDEIGVFDAMGITNYNNCDNVVGELLVGAGVWNGEQLSIVSIGSIDMCPFGGVQLAGFVDGHPVKVKVYRASEEMEYETQLTWNVGSGLFGDVIQSISQIELIDDNAIEGCIDPDACNYNPDATIPSDCEYATENHDCDGNCIVEIDCAGECGGDAVIDECGECGGDGIDEGACDCDGNMPILYCQDVDGDGLGGGEGIESCEAPSGWVANCDDDCDDLAGFDCEGVCGGDAIEDECGECGGDGIDEGECDCDGNLPQDFCYDADGDGLGAGEPFNSCFAPEGWVNDCSDTDPDCATNDTDDCGVCGGDNSCFGCTDSAALNYSEDAYIDDGSCEYAPNYPFWSVHAPDFQYNGSVTCAVEIEDEFVGNEMDQVAAFVGDEVRGVVNGLYFAPTGNYTFNVLAYSNETSGEMLTFKYYDSTNDMVIDMAESIEFISDMIVGNAMNPFILTIPITEVTTQVQLVPGWNWFSVNATGEDMSLNTVLSSVNGSMNYIKSQTSYSEYYDSYGWWGTLENINNEEMYKATANSSNIIAFTGSPVEPSEVQIGLSAGWNWVGYTPQTSLGINTALSSINGLATYIKDQTTYSEYYDSYGWWGTLELMSPYGGYMINTNAEGTLVYPDNLVSVNDDQSNIEFDALEKIVENSTTVDASQYEFNGSVTALISDELSININGDSKLQASVNGELRGIVFAIQSPLSDEFLFPVMLHSNIESGETVEFEIVNGNNESIKFNESLVFSSDMIIGNAETPFLLASIDYGIAHDFEINQAYPNPFNPSTSIDFTLSNNEQLSINVFDMNGRLVQMLSDGVMDAGHHTITWNAENQTSGVYFVKFESENYTSTQKVVLIK